MSCNPMALQYTVHMSPFMSYTSNVDEISFTLLWPAALEYRGLP
jgi:hypothetical protein